MTTHSVTVLPGAIQFDCTEEESILSAAIRAGLVLPYGCRRGNCGTCKAQLLEGEADLETESIYALSEFERDQGFTLLCSAFAVSDLTVEMEGLDFEEVTSGTRPQDLRGTICDLVQLTPDICHVSVAVDEPLTFKAGQFAEVNGEGSGVWRAYSMANRPSVANRLEFMVKLLPSGVFSGWLEQANIGSEVNLRAPHGSFWVRPHDRPLLLIGGGAGMAPLWSIIQDLSETQDPRPVRFFYGARTTADLFYREKLERMAAELSDFQFIPALSHQDTGIPEGCESGLVTEVVDRALGEYDAYLCGPPSMIDAALEMLEGHKLEERKSIFYDKFSPS